MKKFFLIFLLLFSFSANANEILSKNKGDINAIENYLNSITYFSSDFVQHDSLYYELSVGKFYLSRPKKLRLEYTKPSEILLITNDKSTIYYDVELEEFIKLPTKKTPIHFLTREKFDFQNDKKISVVGFEKTDKKIVLKLVEKNKEKQGVISLAFQRNPIALRVIKIDNELEQKITVTFDNIVLNSKIGDELFVFKNPKSDKEIRSRY